MLPNYARLLLILLSAMLLISSYPGRSLPWLAWLAIAPAILAVRGCRAWQGAAWMSLWGTLWWLMSVWWLVPAIVDFANLAQPLAVTLLTLVCAFASLPYALWGASLTYLERFDQRWFVPLAACSLTVCVSFWPQWIPGNPAHTQYIYPLMIQTAEIGGVPLVLTAIGLCNAAAALAIWLLWQRRFKSALCFVLLTLAVPSIQGLYGYTRLQHWHQQWQQDPRQWQLGMIQPRLARKDNPHDMRELTESIVAENPDLDLIAWPEFSPPFSLVDNTYDRKMVETLYQKTQIPMVLTSGYIYEAAPSRANPQPRYYNASHLVDHKGAPSDTYHKQTLVPFFEYLPGEQSFPGLREWFPNVLRYRPGEHNNLFRLSDGTQIATPICYEMIFPHMIGRSVAAGADILVNPSNDGWFGESYGSISHLALALFRTVEHRRPWLRVTNSGISVAVEASGEMLADSRTTLSERTHRITHLHRYRETTLYSQWGDWWRWACVGLLALAVGITSLRRQKQHNNLPESSAS